MDFSILLFGPVLLGVWMLTIHPHTRPSERVSATCRGVELYRFICPSAAIPNHPSTTVHRILPDQFLPHITAQNFVLMRILNGHCNLLRVLACVAPIP